MNVESRNLAATESESMEPKNAPHNTEQDFSNKASIEGCEDCAIFADLSFNQQNQTFYWTVDVSNPSGVVLNREILNLTDPMTADEPLEAEFKTNQHRYQLATTFRIRICPEWNNRDFYVHVMADLLPNVICFHLTWMGMVDAPQGFRFFNLPARWNRLVKLHVDSNIGDFVQILTYERKTFEAVNLKMLTALNARVCCYITATTQIEELSVPQYVFPYSTLDRCLTSLRRLTITTANFENYLGCSLNVTLRAAAIKRCPNLQTLTIERPPNFRCPVWTDFVEEIKTRTMTVRVVNRDTRVEFAFQLPAEGESLAMELENRG